MQTNQAWLLGTLLQFKAPNAKSSSSLDVARVVLGNRTLEINAEMQNLARVISKKLVSSWSMILFNVTHWFFLFFVLQRLSDIIMIMEYFLVWVYTLAIWLIISVPHLSASSLRAKSSTSHSSFYHYYFPSLPLM